MCPEEQRLKVRYSQRFDFCHNASVKKDLILRWLLSDPIIEMKPMSDGHDLPTSPAGDTAPLLTPFNVNQNIRNIACPQDPRITTCFDELLRDLAAMSTVTVVSVA